MEKDNIKEVRKVKIETGEVTFRGFSEFESKKKLRNEKYFTIFLIKIIILVCLNPFNSNA
jgi:hypothetical protein